MWGARFEALCKPVLLAASDFSCNFFRILTSGFEQCALLINVSPVYFRQNDSLRTPSGKTYPLPINTKLRNGTPSLKIVPPAYQFNIKALAFCQSVLTTIQFIPLATIQGLSMKEFRGSRPAITSESNSGHATK